MWRRVVVGVLLVVVSACTDAPAEDATGDEIFGQLCASCHARDLSGGIGPALGAGSEAVDLSDAFITDTIAQGRGSRMPAFSRTLSPEQIDRVVGYIREQQNG